MYVLCHTGIGIACGILPEYIPIGVYTIFRWTVHPSTYVTGIHLSGNCTQRKYKYTTTTMCSTRGMYATCNHYSGKYTYTRWICLGMYITRTCICTYRYDFVCMNCIIPIYGYTLRERCDSPVT